MFSFGSLNQYEHWEGQFIKVTGGGLSKDVIIGNILGAQQTLTKMINSSLPNSYLSFRHLTEQTQMLLLQRNSV